MALKTVKKEVPDVTYTHKENQDKKMEIFREQHPIDPRTEHPLGTMVCSHKRYDLGDTTPEENNMDDKEVAAKLPLYLYDHSQLSIQTESFHGQLPQGHARFDSMQVGFIYITQEELENRGLEDKDTESIKQFLRDEVKHYDNYLKGEVYRYRLKEGEETLDSCGMFNGTISESKERMFDTAGEDPDDYEQTDTAY